MKLFSIKRLIGLGAVYAAVQYARRHGGAKNAFNELLGMAKEKMNEAKDFVGEAKDSVGEAKDSAGEAKDSVGEAKDFVGEAKDSVGEAPSFAAGSGSYRDEDRIGGANAYAGDSSDPSNGRRGY